MSSDWQEQDYFPDRRDQKALVKEFKFANFVEALDFVNKVGQMAEDANHHPDIKLGWGYAQVTLTTHSAHAVTDQDHQLAAQIDKIV